MNRKSTSWLLFAGLAPLFFLFCTNDYNPFADQSNARAVVTHASFGSGDTVSIFTTETVVVRIAVRELVDSFSMIAPSNRRGSDTLVVKPAAGQRLSADPHTCLFSLTDTGWKTITINTFRSNGERVPQDFYVYCRSPLGQSAITGAYGDSLRLSATPVGDDDVMYHWDFGTGFVVTSPLPQATAVVTMQSLVTAGELWVSDPAGVHVSPRFAFSCNLTDNTAPIIMCANEAYKGKDTIVTGDTTFYFKVKIWDPAQAQPVYSAAINGRQFDINDDPFYVRVFDRMDTFKTASPVVVTAIDNQYSRNASQKTFWFRFSDTLVHGRGIFITVSDPQSDISVSSQRQKSIFGYVEDYAHDSVAVAVKLFVNDVPTGETYSARGKYTALWNFPLLLNDGANRIKLVAYSSGNDSLAEKSIIIWYDAALKDTLPPIILDITADGKSADYGYVTGDAAAIRIIAFDEGSGIDSLTINGKPLFMTPQGYGFIWYDTVPVIHRAAGNLFWVQAKDKSGNRDSVSFTLYKNNAPEIILAPPATQPVSVGVAYIGQIRCVDQDNDLLMVQKIDGPAGLTVTSDGQISWTPLLADTGKHLVVTSVSDGYQTLTYTFQLFVVTLSVLPQNVEIDTLLTAYAPYLEAGKDSLVVFVQTLYDSLNTPLTFSAILYNYPLPMNGRLLVWRPGIRDLGRHTITLTVTDRFSRSDTMFASFLVVPPNQPCTLLVSHRIPVTPGGELDLSASAAPETLFFSVKDPDIPAVEQDTIRIRWPGSETQMVLDTTRQFRLILEPQSGAKEKDTVRVLVSDRAGHTDSLTFFMAYVNSIQQKFTGKIVINTKSSGASISTPVAGFPLLVRLDTTFFPREYFSVTAPRGENVRFKRPNGTSIPYQIERWDNAACKAEIWVKIDTVYPMNDDQYILMTWGSGPVEDSSKGSAVFDTASGYVGAWHMNDGSMSQNANSAQEQFYTTPTGGANPSIRYGEGIIATADSLANNRYLNAGQLPAMQQVSMSLWVNPTQKTPWAKIICKSWNNYGPPYQVFSMEVSGGKDTAILFHVGLSAQFSGYAVSKDSCVNNKWTHLAATYDGMNNLLYMNGVPAGAYSWPNSPVPAVPVNQQPWYIGGWNYNQNECFQGKIDEARIYRGVWGPDYIKLSYENQRMGSALLQFR